MITNSEQLSMTEPKKTKQNKNKLGKQLEEEQNHRNGDNMEGHQWGGRRMGEKVQGISSMIGRYKIDRGRLRIVQEMEKPKNLYAWFMDMN